MSGYIGTQPVPQATQTRQTFTATASQASFATGGYQAGYLDVFLNGVKLVDGTDFTATNGSDVVLTSGAAAGDTLEVVAYTAFEVAAGVTLELVGNISSGTLDLSTGNVFSDAPSANATYVFSNPPASGTAYGFTLKITPSATVTITWPTSVDWPAATAPDAPASGATNVYSFYTQDGGTTYYGFLAGGAMG